MEKKKKKWYKWNVFLKDFKEIFLSYSKLFSRKNNVSKAINQQLFFFKFSDFDVRICDYVL